MCRGCLVYRTKFVEYGGAWEEEDLREVHECVKNEMQKYELTEEDAG